MINDDKYRRGYDPAFECGHIIERYNELFCLMYTKVKKISIVASREFVIF